MSHIDKYFEHIDKGVQETYKLANTARALDLDPETTTIPLAKNMAERVEGIIGAAYPQIIGSGLSKRIEELEEKYGKLDFRVALTVSLEVTQETFCTFTDKKEAIEAGIRVGLAYLTLGVVSSPLEGFVELKINKTKTGKDYFCLMYSGPIRSAGGTAGALSVILADHLRKALGYAAYDPTEEELRRTVTELQDYHERVTNLQYYPSEDEIMFMGKHVPVQINGDPSEKIEVSNYKDLERIETNQIRSGICLVVGECLTQKASKVRKIIQNAEGFDLTQWDFLDDFIKLQKQVKAADTKVGGKISPDYTYIKDLVAGRPILTHPLATGGFRLRYGRCRTTGYSSTAIHPCTMLILNKYIATGTQLKMERPGKATALTVCDFIEGPIVKLKDESVVRLETEAEAKQYVKDIEEILFLGDILISYGDFYNRAHALVPPGYCEEWWSLELEKALQEQKREVGVSKEVLDTLIKNPIKTKIDAQTAFLLARHVTIPLHPAFTYHWNSIDVDEFTHLTEYLLNPTTTSLQDNPIKIILNYSPKIKDIFDKIGVPHTVTNKEFIVLEKDHAYTFHELFNLSQKREVAVDPETKETGALALLNKVSDVTVRDKSGIFIGARMGRPEKAKMRKLTGSPHTLFPIGEEGGRLRSFQSALAEGKITAEFSKRWLKKTEENHNITNTILFDANDYVKAEFNIGDYFKSTVKGLELTVYPDLIKGVRGTSNRDHTPEHFAKGILRAVHDICVNKDGTIRYDMTQLPITHFKPKEVGTSVDRLIELGYYTDIHGNQLEHDNQLLELLPQDVILPSCSESPEWGAGKVLLKTGKFIDDLLAKFYKLGPHYKFSKENDLAGTLVAAIAPHTSAAVVGRIVGFSKTQGFFCHPVFHAATRRDCDGDEASVMLLMDALLNFSKNYLPNTRGATQDAPLVLTSKLIPAEVDDMAFDVDIGWRYPLEFYEACLAHKKPWDVKIEQFTTRLDTPEQYFGLGFTHDTDSINAGVRCSAYKILPSMQEKLGGQMELAERIKAVDEADVARLVIEKHLIRDIRGNLRKFSMQQFRCSTCNEKYRRPPLVGKCLKCKGKIIFTISEGSIVKYLEPAISLANKYNLPAFLKQNLEVTKRNVESLFGREKEKQEGLGKWFG